MGKFSSTLDWFGRANAVAWAWSFVPSSVGATIVGWLAHSASQQLWVVILAASVVFAAISVAFAAWRSHKNTSVAQSSYQELERRSYSSHLAELRGKERAEASFLFDQHYGLNNRHALQKHWEEQEARRKGHLKRLEEGKEQ